MNDQATRRCSKNPTSSNKISIKSSGFQGLFEPVIPSLPHLGVGDKIYILDPEDLQIECRTIRKLAMYGDRIMYVVEDGMWPKSGYGREYFASSFDAVRIANAIRADRIIQKKWRWQKQ